MKRFIKYINILLALALFSCADNDVNIDDPSGNGGSPAPSYYLALNVKLPSDGASSRSTTKEDGTSSDETVKATDPEKEIVDATIYLLDEENNIQLQLNAESDQTVVDENTGRTTVCAEIKDEDFQTLKTLKGKNLKIYIVANIGATSLDHDFTGSILPKNATFKVSEFSGAIGKFNGNGKYGKNLPLVNAEDPELNIEIPDDVDDDELISSIKSRFTRAIGTSVYWDVNKKTKVIDLERAVARLEYRGKVNENDESFSEDTNNIFQIGELNVNVKLYSMTPFNINQDCYLFRHTVTGGFDSALGIEGKQPEIFGNENGNDEDTYNWIVSPWWPSGTPTLMNKLGVTEHEYVFSSPVSDSEIKVADILGAKSEDLQKKNETYIGGYHPFCYVTENTLFNTDIMADDKVMDYATGVAFKFIVLNENNKPIKVNDPTTWVFPAEITWNPEEGKGCPRNEDGTENGNLGHINITDLSTWEWIDVAPSTVDGLYYITLVAPIKHNERTIDGAFAPMYYGVVRNNSYQMSIKQIKGIPNPRDPRTYFIELDINVLNWNSRDVGFDF